MSETPPLNIGKARRPMRILWSSNALFAGTGYGAQSAQAIPRLCALGHEVAHFAWYGLQGASLNYAVQHQGASYPVLLYPGVGEGYGNNMAALYAAHHRAHITITLIDAWVLDPQAHGGARAWAPWFPVDAWPVPPAVLGAVKEALRPIVFSRFGERMLRDAGLDCAYVPHAVDTAVFSPGDRAEARARLGIPADAFVALMVAANKDNPSRKGLPAALHAFAHLARRRPDARLALHTVMRGATDLDALARRLDIADRLIVSNQASVASGAYDDAHMATLYRAADVLLAPSMGEGFGVPILEAQACGVPVITGAWTAMDELVFAGWRLERPRDEVEGYGAVPDDHYGPQDAYWGRARVGQILEALDEAYRAKGTAAAAQHAFDARGGALAYDADLVARDYWRPVLDEIAERLGVEEAPQ